MCAVDRTPRNLHTDYMRFRPVVLRDQPMHANDPSHTIGVDGHTIGAHRAGIRKPLEGDGSGHEVANITCLEGGRALVWTCAVSTLLSRGCLLRAGSGVLYNTAAMLACLRA